MDYSGTTKYTKQTKSLAAGPTMPEGFNYKNKTLIMKDVNGFGGSAVVMRCAAAKNVMRKLVPMEKILCEKTRK